MIKKINPKNPYKKQEFKAFLKIIKENSTAHWIQVANILGVDKTTITEWKKHPLAKDAILKGIETALKGMEKSGKDDWRMWESKLKMLGVSPTEKQDVTSGDEPIPFPILGGMSDTSDTTT